MSKDSYYIKEDYTIFDSEALQNRFISLWLEIKRQFAGNDNITFELLNKMRDVDPELWNDLADRTTCAIREKNPTRKIIVGSSCWNNPNKLKFLRLYDGEKVLRNRPDVWYATNGEIYDYVTAYDRLEFSPDGAYVYNPSAVDVYISFFGQQHIIPAGHTKFVNLK